MFSHPFIENIFDFEQDYINTLIIENPVFFTEIISDIYKQCEGEEGDSVLSDKYTPLAFSKNAELITQFVPFSINQKTLITKLNQTLERSAVSEEFYLSTQEVLQKIEKWLFDISFPLPLDIETTKLNPANLIKSAGVSFSEDNTCLTQKIIDYMDVMRELDHERVFIFVNLRCYIEEEKCDKFFETVLDHDFKIFLIESFEKNLLKKERRVIIDNDLCEILR